MYSVLSAAIFPVWETLLLAPAEPTKAMELQTPLTVFYRIPLGCATQLVNGTAARKTAPKPAKARPSGRTTPSSRSFWTKVLLASWALSSALEDEEDIMGSGRLV